MKLTLPSLSVAVVSCVLSPASGALTEWRIEDGGNGHWYDIVVTPLQSWMESKA